MPYIDTEKVAQMRKAIRKALPDYKISVTKHHHSTVNVAILSGPIPAVENVNEFHYKRDLADRPEAIAVIDIIVKAIFDVQEPRELVYDGDYGSVPTFYYSIRFGTWDKPYICTDPNAEAELADRLEIRREFNFIKQESDYREWKSKQQQRCGIMTLAPDDLIVPCISPVNHAGFCDTGR